MGFTKREIKTKEMTLTIELNLINSSLTPQEASERLTYLFNLSRCKELSEFIVMLMRETQSSMWETKKMEIN